MATLCVDMLPVLPPELQHLQERVAEHRGPHWRRAHLAVADTGALDPAANEDRQTLIRFLQLRRIMKPTSFAAAYAAANPDQVGILRVIHLTNVKSRPTEIKAYRIKSGRSRGTTKPDGPDLAAIDIRPVQLGHTDQPLIVTS